MTAFAQSLVVETIAAWLSISVSGMARISFGSTASVDSQSLSLSEKYSLTKRFERKSLTIRRNCL